MIKKILVLVGINEIELLMISPNHFADLKCRKASKNVRFILFHSLP